MYRNYNSFGCFVQDFPPSFIQIPPIAIPVRNPEGRNSTFYGKNTRTGVEIQTTYELSHTNTVVAGGTYEEMSQYDIRRTGNFAYIFSKYFLTDLFTLNGGMARQTAEDDVTRNFKALFIEDIWDITRNIRLTAGGRYDDYSDFGDSFNPRIGLTWEFLSGYDLKLLYSSAFRAPSFTELYDINYGDPNLKPEEVDTYQVSLGAEFNSEFSNRVTWYQNWTKNTIAPLMEPGVEFLRNKNYGKMRSEGLEYEMKYDFGRGSYLVVNYTNQLFIKRDFQWFVPKHTGNVMLNVRLSRYLNFNTDCHFEDGFRRQEGDTRADKPGYGIVNATLIARQFLEDYKGLELRASVYNLFDKDYTSPTGTLELPHDLPRPGRTFLFEVKYTF
jgi:outer membrane receptor for ferrienterochelin and colicins